ncbi:MAG: VanW family protein [Anaerolineales bacterium]
MNTLSYPSPRVSLWTQALVSLLVGSFLFVFLLFAWVLGYQITYAGRIFPGVSVAGVDLSGLSPVQAAARLQQTLTFPLNGRILLRDGAQVWLASPVELGLVLDTQASAQAAYRIGREGGLLRRLEAQWRARRGGVLLPPVLIFDQRLAYAALQRLAQEIDRPAVEAHLEIHGTEVIAQPGQIGRRLDLEASLQAITLQLQRFQDGEVNLVVREEFPQILDVSAQAEAARRLLSAPLQLTLPNAVEGERAVWTFEPQVIAKMLTVRRVDEGGQSRLELVFDPSLLRPGLEAIASQVNRQPQNARFYFDDETRQLVLIQSATIGRTLDVEASIQAINQALLRGEHTVALVVQETPPAVKDDATAESLGIRELVGTAVTYFYGSSAARIQNIETAAARFHGVLIAPGETFSMGKVLGDVSLDNGYAEALIIYGGRTIKGVGGGVCQVSTTLFRAVFFAGYPIVERHSHAYRVTYYEQTASGDVDPRLAGLDATVYFPLVDFKFTNDRPYWLLMETYVNVAARRITWKLYSTNDGRQVEWSTSGLLNVVPAPKPRFEANPELAAGEIKQVDWAADGADVIVTRIVRRDGQVLFQDEFRTHYEPWQAVCQFGPGTKNPEKRAKDLGLCQNPSD